MKNDAVRVQVIIITRNVYINHFKGGKIVSDANSKCLCESFVPPLSRGDEREQGVESDGINDTRTG